MKSSRTSILVCGFFGVMRYIIGFSGYFIEVDGVQRQKILNALSSDNLIDLGHGLMVKPSAIIYIHESGDTSRTQN